MVRIVKKPEIRRQEIISAAKELFLQKNYEKTTMRDVMTQLNIAKGTIYHYFKSKDELLDAVVNNIAEEQFDYIQKGFSKNKKDAVEKLKELIHAINISRKQKKLLQQLHSKGNVELHIRLLAISISKLTPLFAQIIEQGCSEGIFDTEYPLESAELLIAGIQFLTDTGFYSWPQKEILRRKKAIPALFEAQLKAPTGTFDVISETKEK